jgi:hypothetical protein
MTTVGTRAKPYVRQRDGRLTAKLQVTVTLELLNRERIFSAGLLPPWDRQRFIDYALTRAMDEWEANGPPVTTEKDQAADGDGV